MKKPSQPTSLAVLLLPCLSLLFLVVAVEANTQYVVPCSFNPMCSCKMSQSSHTVETEDYLAEGDLRNRTSSELAVDGTQRESGQDADMSTIVGAGNIEQAFDVSCVGVPFAFLPGIRTLEAGTLVLKFAFPYIFVMFYFCIRYAGCHSALPSGKLSHVDIVSSGLEVAELIPPSKISSSVSPRIQIESLRLMSNKICHIGDNLFR